MSEYHNHSFTEATSAIATTSPAATTKAPAFELVFAVGALFIATLVRRR